MIDNFNSEADVKDRKKNLKTKSKAWKQSLTAMLFFCLVQTAAFASADNLHPSSQPPPIANARSQEGFAGPYFMGELLIWRAQQEGLEYAIEIDDLPSNAAIGKGKVRNLGDTDWNAGFRVGVGYLFHRDLWSLDAEWTRFHPSSVSSHLATDDFSQEPIFPVFPQIGNWSAFNPVSISPKWDLKYDTVDLLASRQFSIRKFLVLKPSFGLSSAWIQQDFDLKVDAENGNTDFFVNFKTDNDFWGVGLKAGLDSNWLLGPHFRLFGKISGTLLWGHFTIKEKGSGTYPNGPINPFSTNQSPNIHLKDSFHTIQASMNLKLGLAWRWGFHHNKRECVLYCGWEEFLWFNQNQLPFITSFSMNKHAVHGDLGLSGFDIGLNVKL